VREDFGIGHLLEYRFHFSPVPPVADCLSFFSDWAVVMSRIGVFRFERAMLWPFKPVLVHLGEKVQCNRKA
jgi:hypothetical protein